MRRTHDRGTNQVQKKIAVINDISGFGRCAVAVALPIISYMGVQCCPVPTAILSNHMGYPNYYMDNYTDRMEEYIGNWRKLGLRFDGITTGFLGSVEQIAIVKRFIRDFSQEGTMVIVDPVMGDHGRLYSTYTEELCIQMRKLIGQAHITTPNLTEACRLADMPYRDGVWRKKELRSMAEQIAAMGPDRVVITGIPQGEFIANYVYERGAEPQIIRTHKVGTERSGTGDVFSSVIAADGVNGVPFHKSVRKASGFVKKCILRTEEQAVPKSDGVCFEEILYQLKRD
ncbi:MAG: pyridoxamine kinase [Lachnospiraceae bacterium]|nr:pyridoxamine kinase [Lachnospiraceae bacterium]